MKVNETIFEKVLNLPKLIVDYLFDNAPNLWKLLYYINEKDYPLNQNELTNAEKANMICSTPSDMYDVNVSTQKNILFQLQIDEAFSNAVPQIRICTGKKRKINAYQGFVEVYFQIVIPNKQLLFMKSDNTVCDRSDAIVCELMKALDRNEEITKIIPINSPFFMNSDAPDGAGRNTGSDRDVQNKNFSGQYLTLSCLV